MVSCIISGNGIFILIYFQIIDTSYSKGFDFTEYLYNNSSTVQNHGSIMVSYQQRFYWITIRLRLHECNFSLVFSAEPMKKKKKIDPAIVKAREDRRRKKLEKQIRRLEKNARQLKPIDELEVPLHLIDEMK